MIILFSQSLGLDPMDVLGTSREHPLPLARQLYWKCLRENARYTLKKIGRLSDRHHTTIYSGINKVNDLLSVNDQLTVEMWRKVKGISVETQCFASNK